MSENEEISQKQEVSTTPYIDLPTRFDRWEPLAEVIVTVVLAFATLATAWSGYQAARWGGEQSNSYSQAGALRTESTRASTQAGQQAQVDIGLFTNWINAFAAEDQELAVFYQDHFRDEFKPAFEAWLATDPVNNPDAPATPFSMPEYQLSLAAEADRLIRISDYWTSQLGFLVSYIQKQIDNKDFIWSDQLDNLHGLLYPQSSFTGFANQNISYADLNLGGAVHYEKYYFSATFGLAVHHVTKPNESFSSLEQRLPRKYIFSSDFVVLQRSNPKKGFKFNPGLLYEYFAGYHTFTLGSNVAKSVLYGGLWYRSKQSQIYNYQSVIALVGINIPMVNKYSRLKLMYSYDISINNMKGTGGAHEITLRFEFDQIHLFKSSSSFADDYPIIYDPVVF